MKAWGCAPISANLFLHIAPLAIGVDIEGLSRDTDWKPMLLYAGVSMPWVREGRLLRHRSKLRRAMIGVGMPVIGTPPSEPNRPISGIRLSSWWLAFKKIGVPHGKPVLRRTGPLW